MSENKKIRCVSVNGENLNNYEFMIDLAMTTLGDRVSGFLTKLAGDMAAKESGTQAEAEVREFIVEFSIIKLLTADFVFGYAQKLHENWGNAECESFEQQRKITDLKGVIDFRVREHSPQNPDLRHAVLKLSGGKCAYCGVAVTASNMHVEHVVPKKAGGPDHLRNYVAACSACNISKSDRHVLDFIARKMGRKS